MPRLVWTGFPLEPSEYVGSQVGPGQGPVWSGIPAMTLPWTCAASSVVPKAPSVILLGFTATQRVGTKTGKSLGKLEPAGGVGSTRFTFQPETAGLVS